jgi:hypothetical protein
MNGQLSPFVPAEAGTQLFDGKVAVARMERSAIRGRRSRVSLALNPDYGLPARGAIADLTRGLS